uniref:Lectin n=1 Tax=Euperipatoides rowelli TaxID=49087 RepID=D9IX74_EUPRO|nr:lectin [Euperipatoides rowelli]
MAVNFLSVLLLSSLVLLTLIHSTKSNSITICEHTTGYINCDKDTKIEIISSDYGRQSKDICPSSGFKLFWSPDNLHCRYDASDVVRKTCDGQKSCSVKADNNWLGKDPCGDTFKYLTVKFSCYHEVVHEHDFGSERRVYIEESK